MPFKPKLELNFQDNTNDKEKEYEFSPIINLD